jgi:hypothetical protein
MEELEIQATDEFIAKNNFKLKTQDEIVAKLDDDTNKRFMDFTPDVLVPALEWDFAKKYLKEDYVEKVEKGEEKFEYASDIKTIVQEFLDYMVFAWGKAEDERGLSAYRSISKLSAWLWLLNREDLVNTIEDNNLYNPYGAPALIEVCNQLGIEVPESLVEFSKEKC